MGKLFIKKNIFVILLIMMLAVSGGCAQSGQDQGVQEQTAPEEQSAYIPGDIRLGVPDGIIRYGRPRNGNR